MAFVFKEQKTLPLQPDQTVVLQIDEWAHFTTTKKRTKPQFKHHTNFVMKQPKISPAPNAYQLPSQFKKKQPIKAPFWSKESRDPKIAQDIPGPGSYSPQKNQKPQMPPLKRKQNSVKTLANKIPSIPQKYHTGYSYKINDPKILTRILSNVEEHSGTLDDSVGPGSYNIDKSFQNNAKKWIKKSFCFLSQTGRSELFNQTTNLIGPGQYQHLTTIQLNKRKPKELKKAKLMPLNPVQDSESQENYQYEIECNPGPGHYELPSTISVHKGMKFNARGGNLRSSPTIGPGQYSLSQPKFNIRKRARYAFNCNSSKFNYQNLQKQPGPFQYSPQTTMQCTLIKRLQLGYKGDFLFKEKRFSDLSKTLTPGRYEVKLSESQPIQNSVFKSKALRIPKIKNQNPAPNAYAMISQQGTEKQVAGVSFMSSIPNDKIYLLENVPIKPHNFYEFYLNGQSKGSFNKEPKFTQKKDNTIMSSLYLRPSWNIKSHNVQFA